jgi:hypothetical protein
MLPVIVLSALLLAILINYAIYSHERHGQHK